MSNSQYFSFQFPEDLLIKLDFKIACSCAVLKWVCLSCVVRGPKYHLLAHTTLSLSHIQDSFRTHDLTISGNGEWQPQPPLSSATSTICHSFFFNPHFLTFSYLLSTNCLWTECMIRSPAPRLPCSTVKVTANKSSLSDVAAAMMAANKGAHPRQTYRPLVFHLLALQSAVKFHNCALTFQAAAGLAPVSLVWCTEGWWGTVPLGGEMDANVEYLIY